MKVMPIRQLIVGIVLTVITVGFLIMLIGYRQISQRRSIVVSGSLFVSMNTDLTIAFLHHPNYVSLQMFGTWPMNIAAGRPNPFRPFAVVPVVPVQR